MTEQVYFAKAGARVKIGFSTNVPKRINSLQTAVSERLELLAAVDADMGVEIALHRRLRAHHIQREWFSDCDELRAVLRDLLETGPSSLGDLYAEMPPRQSRGKAGPRPPVFDLTDEESDEADALHGRAYRVIAIYKRRARNDPENGITVLGLLRETIDAVIGASGPHPSATGAREAIDHAKEVLHRTELTALRLLGADAWQREQLIDEHARTSALVQALKEFDRSN